MFLRKNIPNAITCGNLFCGVLAIIKTMQGDLVWTAYLVGIAAILDFFDGLAARVLNANSPIGKDLDSLADMVSFGVVPALVMYKLIDLSVVLSFTKQLKELGAGSPDTFTQDNLYKYIGLIIAVFSALRLAKFNNDTRQSESFIGLPTPANSIFVCGLPLIYDKLGLNFWNLQQVIDSEKEFQQAGNVTGIVAMFLLSSPFILSALSLLLSFLLVAEIPLLSFKFKKLSWKGNEARYALAGTCLFLLLILRVNAIPLLVILYILISFVNNIFQKTRV